MRLLRARRHLNGSECRAIIAAAATLASMFNIAWRVADNAAGQSPAALAGSLSEARRDGSTFLVPGQARGWFDLSFDIPDTRYALALILVWSFAAAGTPDGGAPAGSHVSVAMWHLRHLLPRSAHRALADIEYAFAQFNPPAHTDARVG
ncbi:hypothetical protein ACFFMM_11115 [Micromonospora chaiyaphumensis]|uniref:Uncharacterized protein n=1 Tax=Micromonospora chaiyaphumensis TaxID=307119 RepID=A0A1C4W6K2_9ACTN|nr:hypothetical protein [Micromonospora chaiyaphumensis]SCE91815.1 hypothetical protein GA0070214_103266 [Micromonospora chaiyaphumensis]